MHLKAKCLLVLIILLSFITPTSALGEKPSFNYDKQITVIVQPNTKLKKALKGLDLKQIKNLRIEDIPNEQITLDFWDSYSILKKMTALETLDVSECQSLNKALYNDPHNATLPISKLVLKFLSSESESEFPNNPVLAALFFNNEYPPISFEANMHVEPNYKNLTELIIVGPQSDLLSSSLSEHDLYANLNYGNSFVASYNPKSQLIKYKRLDNLNRPYQFILGGEHSSLIRNRTATSITPTNKRLEGVVASDASFVNYLPEKISKLTIPKTVLNLLGDYCDQYVFVDTLIVEESPNLLIINHGGLYGLQIANAIFNRPIRMNGKPGISTFSGSGQLVFNKFANLSSPNFRIKQITFNGPTEIEATLARDAEEIIFNDEVSMKGDPFNPGSEVLEGVKEVFFKKAPTIDNNARFRDVDKVFISADAKGKCFHWLLDKAKEMNFDTKTVIDPRITPDENMKIKTLQFNDPNIHDVEVVGTNRILYFQTANGKTLNDGQYYVPVSDNLYLSFSTANLYQEGESVRLSCGSLYNTPGNNIETYIMVFSYIPVDNINGIEYGRTTGFYLVNPNGEIVNDFTYYATEISDRTTPYIPPIPQKETKSKRQYHEIGKMENCKFCHGSGLATKYLGQEQKICRYCGGKGWYIEHYW